jgi:hypothetical protein
MGSTPKRSAPPPAPPPPPPIEILTDTTATERQGRRRDLAGQVNRKSTILTNQNSLGSPNSKALLGA